MALQIHASESKYQVSSNMYPVKSNFIHCEVSFDPTLKTAVNGCPRDISIITPHIAAVAAVAAAATLPQPAVWMRVVHRWTAAGRTNLSGKAALCPAVLQDWRKDL